MNRPLVGIGLWVVLGVVSLAAVAQESGSEEKSATTKDWLEQRRKAFAEYRFRIQTSDASLLMEPRSMLNWSNPERAAGRGGVFLWTYEGRPQMLACAFMSGPDVQHEFQSLSTEPIVGERDSREVHRFASGIEWIRLEKGPEPADKRPLRLIQFRQQAQRFRASFGYEDKWTEARRLTQPVYLSTNADIAMFLFVQGTDPECTLLLEATKDTGWRYALARQTTFGLQVQLDDREVWNRIAAWSPQAKPDPSYVVRDEKPK